MANNQFRQIAGFAMLALILGNCSEDETEQDSKKEDLIETDSTSSGETSTDSSFVIFSDDFETGDYSKTENGFEWTGTTEISETPNGTLGIKFKYGPDAILEDSWREHRYLLGANYGDLWIKYDLYIPENYHHRCPVALKLDRAATSFAVGDTVVKVDNSTGTLIVTEDDWGIVKHISTDTIYVDELPEYLTFLDNHEAHNELQNKRTDAVYTVTERLGYGNNNKLGVIWQGEYGSANTGNSVEMGLWYGNRGNSYLSYYPAKDHGAWRAGHTISEEPFIDKSADLGKWMEVIIHLKIASESNDDGIIEVWKNGEKYFDTTNLPNHSELGYNYYDKGYLLGWSNSGFEEETILYIDNVIFSTETISPK